MVTTVEEIIADILDAMMEVQSKRSEVIQRLNEAFSLLKIGKQTEVDGMDMQTLALEDIERLQNELQAYEIEEGNYRIKLEQQKGLLPNDY